jgi:hypothetical protein
MEVYIKPKPKTRIESERIDHFEIEKDGGAGISQKTRL